MFLTLSTMKSLITSSPLPLLSPLTLPKSKPLFSFSLHTICSPIKTSFLHLGKSNSGSRPLFCRNSVRLVCSGSDGGSMPHGRGQTWGEIHVIVGPMFAGKTTTLLRRVQSVVGNERCVAIIKSDKDARYGLDSIMTHDGDKYPCFALKDLSSFRKKFDGRAYDESDVIGIDEAQFFQDLYDFCQSAADHDGKTVIVSGLDGDYLRPFIIPLADSVTKLTARCEMCGKLAHFTLRKSGETKTELIDGAEKYMHVVQATLH